MRRHVGIAVIVDGGEPRLLASGELRGTNGTHATDPFEIAELLRETADDIYRENGGPYWNAAPMPDPDTGMGLGETGLSGTL